MHCKICQNKSQKIFSAKILKKYNVDYFHCSRCGFLQTEEPYWLEQAYKNPIAASDTGVLARNMNLSKITAVLAYFLFDKKGRYLDYAGGYGIFTRLMRDLGFDCFWYDPYTPNLFAQGFEIDLNTKPTFDLVTSFECFEHLPDPCKEIEAMLALAPSILFTTDFLPSPIPAPDSWWYYACDEGQHISFYTPKTCQYIAQKYGLNFYSHWGIHLLTKKPLSFFFFRKLIEHHKLLFWYVKRYAR